MHNCVVCGRELSNEKQEVCSKECYVSQRQAKRKCQVCDNEFNSLLNSNRQFCSSACLRSTLEQDVLSDDSIQLTCIECSSALTVSMKEFTSKKHHFCGQLCYVKWHETPKIIRRCVSCRTEFIVKSDSTQFYCMKDCAPQQDTKALVTVNSYYSLKCGWVTFETECERRRMIELDLDQNVVDWGRCTDVIQWTDNVGSLNEYRPTFTVYYRHSDSGKPRIKVVEDINGWGQTNQTEKVNAAHAFYSRKGTIFRILPVESDIHVTPLYTQYENDVGVFSRLSYETIWMQLAVSLSKRSTCLRRQVGVVITDSEMTRALCIGYNGDHAGGANQCDSLVPGHCGCTHAEINALSKSISDLSSCTLFITLAPCKACAKVLITRKVSRVVYLESYRHDEGVRLLRDMEVDVVKYQDFITFAGK